MARKWHDLVDGLQTFGLFCIIKDRPNMRDVCCSICFIHSFSFIFFFFAPIGTFHTISCVQQPHCVSKHNQQHQSRPHKLLNVSLWPVSWNKTRYIAEQCTCWVHIHLACIDGSCRPLFRKRSVADFKQLIVKISTLETMCALCS